MSTKFKLDLAVIKDALIAYPWASTITLTYPNKKSFNASHRQDFFTWLKSKNMSFFWLFKLNNQNLPQYIILLNIDVNHREASEKWKSLVTNGRCTTDI